MVCEGLFKIRTNFAKATKISCHKGQFVDRTALQVAIPAKIGMIMRIIVIVSHVRAGCRQCNIVMSQTPKNALVPAGPKNLPVVRKPGKVGRYNLVNEGVRFKNREEVRERLPDILGKALAMIWIDKEFADGFARDPQKILEAEGIILPENMAIEFQKPGTDRPRIVVYEKRPNSNFRLRVLYLQLVMMAGR